MNNAADNTENLRSLFDQCAQDVKLRGIIGVTAFNHVYDSLMDVQKKRMKELVGDQLRQLLEDGSIISFAYAYPDGIIDNSRPGFTAPGAGRARAVSA